MPRSTQIALFASLFVAMLLFGAACQSDIVAEDNPIIFSTQGELRITELGTTLTHEHLFSNFGAEPNFEGQYDEKALLQQVIPYLRKLDSLGAHTIMDCTAAYFGRNTRLLKQITDSTGVQIVTNTGIYGAAKDRYIPPFAYDESIEAISKRWIAEFKSGIGDSGIRPGFIKLAFDGGPPSEIDLKLFEAGCRTHLKTGLTLAVHTGNNPDAAEAQLDILAQYKIHPQAWIWTHANKVEEDEVLLKAARQGAWISLDGVKAGNIESYVNRISLFKAEGLMDHILLSHDGNSFPRGGAIRPYDAIFTHLIPALRAAEFSQAEISQLTVQNPAKAFGIRVRTSA